MSLVSVTTEAFPVLIKYAEAEDPFQLPTDKQEQVRALLESEDTTATGVFRAVQALLGSAFITWEPESIWLELEDRKIDLPELNRGKILAFSTLLQVPAFYWDANVFENTALSCSNEPVMPEILQEASPAQLTWAVYECEVFLQSDGQDPDFDYEPAKYAAVCMHREGLVLAPDLLQFAQEELDRLNRKPGAELKGEVQSRWDELKKDQLDAQEFEETPVGVQLARLSAIQLYFDTQLKRYEEDLLVLGNLL